MELCSADAHLLLELPKETMSDIDPPKCRKPLSLQHRFAVPAARVTGQKLISGKFTEILWKSHGNLQKSTLYCVRKGCGNSVESLRKFRGKMFCNDPFPKDPISELLSSACSA